MSGTLKLGGKTLATHDTNSNKLSFHPDANDTGQLCRAWVNFNGTGTVVIRAAYNVSSITDNGGSGYYDINLTNAMDDGNFCVTTAVGNLTMTDSSGYARNVDAVPLNSSTVRCLTFVSDTNSLIDVDTITIAIFR